MKANQKKHRGFTLMEIPTVSGQLEKSRRAVDMADARGILAALSTGYLSGDIHFTSDTFEGNPTCVAVVVGKNGMQCYVSGATEVKGVSYDNSKDGNGVGVGHERIQAYLTAAGYEGCTVHARQADGDNGWAFYAVLLYSDGTTRIASGTGDDSGAYRDDTFEENAGYWRKQNPSNLETAMGRG